MSLHAALSRIESPAAGTPRGLVLALHGGGYCGGYWDCPVDDASFVCIANHLGFSVLAPDRPGYRATAGIDPEATRLDAQVETFFALLDDWRARNPAGTPAFVIGHSIGGILALKMAAHARGIELGGVDALGVPIRFPATAAGSTVQDLPAQGDYATPLDDAARRWLMFGPEGTWSEAAFAHDRALPQPMPLAEYHDAIAMPGRWDAVLGRVRIPVQLTAADHEAMQETGESVLAEVRAGLLNAPHVRTLRQPASGHNASLHHVARSYHLRALAFFEECIALQRAGCSGVASG